MLPPILRSYAQTIQNQKLPCAFVDLAAFDRNLEKILKIIADLGRSSSLKVRLATKSIRTPELLSRAQKRLGDSCSGLMCFSAREIEILAGMGFDDFLLAYPTYQESDFEALQRVCAAKKRVTVIVDCEKGIDALARVKTGGVMRLAIDVDASLRLFRGLVHLGVRRSPVTEKNKLLALLKYAQNYPNLKVVGAMAYEAQVAGLNDRSPFKPFLNPIAYLVRRVSLIALKKRRREVVDAFAETNTHLEFFNGGGSGSLNLTAADGAITEIGLGSALFSSHLFDYFSNIRFEPAAFFGLQITRLPAPGMATLQGGGYIASGDPGWQKAPIPVYPPNLKLLPDEGCGEVQTPLKGFAEAPNLGDVVLFRHAKSGELMEHFEEVLLLENGAIKNRVPTYRGLGARF